MKTRLTMPACLAMTLLGLLPLSAKADAFYSRPEGTALAAGDSFKGVKAHDPIGKPVLSGLQDTTAGDLVHPSWLTTIPFSVVVNKSFLAGSSFLASTGGLPEGITPVSWSGNFYTDSKAVTLQWQWEGVAGGRPDTTLGERGGSLDGGKLNFAGTPSGTGSIVPNNVPEPATLSLLAVGAGLLLRRRKAAARNN